MIKILDKVSDVLEKTKDNKLKLNELRGLV